MTEKHKIYEKTPKKKTEKHGPSQRPTLQKKLSRGLMVEPWRPWQLKALHGPFERLIHIYIYVCVYVYIYMYMCIYICVLYIYIYVYMIHNSRC